MPKTAQNEASVEIKVMQIADLVHSDANPRTIRRNRHEDLKQSLTEFPEMKDIREIVVDENNLILAGDKRTYALEEMGYTDVRVKQVTGLTERQKRRFILIDNDHNGQWDTDKLANEWDADELKEFKLPDFSKMPGEDQPSDKADKGNSILVCPECGHEGNSKEFNSDN